MKFKKVLATGIAAAMTMGVLAGCGGGDSGSAAGTESAGDSGEIVNLKWVSIGNGMPANYDTWVGSPRR